ncbi:MAG: 3-deoxy-manno-octulosonate cytidylyltransferase [Cytophagaceae bacterium]|jgi:3-deoxy-manno-octulosonate cytidylyltransferase (CMP-KDO synthetase)|nr:3-deoxy-manno-octulosonate cytidylyltransferase [Cytophagaceae bacterium]
MILDDILGIIPARYASTRFPGKPLADIGGKPMIQRVYEQSRKALKYVYVATDDIRIENAVLAFGGNVVMTSPDNKSGTDRCAEALNIIEQATGKSFEAVINIQGDEPFIEPHLLEMLSVSFMSSFTEIATLVKPLTKTEDLFDANKPKVVVNIKYEALYFSRSPIPYLRNVAKEDWVKNHKYYAHIGLYGYRSDILREITMLKPSSLELAESLEQLRWLENGYTISVRETEHESIAIDTPDDLKKTRQWLMCH